jgi:hypothetical protein
VTDESRKQSKKGKVPDAPADDDDKVVQLVRSSLSPLREPAGGLMNVDGVVLCAQDLNVKEKIAGAQALRHGSDQNLDSVHAVPPHPLHDAGLPPGLSQECPTCGKFPEYLQAYLQACGKTPIGSDADQFNDKAVIRITIPQKLIQGSDTTKTYVEQVPIQIFSDCDCESESPCTFASI